jgi:hypothetical protein
MRVLHDHVIDRCIAALRLRRRTHGKLGSVAMKRNVGGEVVANRDRLSPMPGAPDEGPGLQA